MKRSIGIIGLALAVALTGCSKAADNAKTTEPEEQATEVVDEEPPAYATASDIITGEVWQYKYAGRTDPAMEAITDEICKMSEQLVSREDGMFPAVEIVKTIQKDDIVSYYTVVAASSYDLKGTLLMEKSYFGGPMRFDLKQASDGSFTVEKCVMAEDGEGWFDSIVEFCDGDKDLAMQIVKRPMHLQTVLDFIRDYIKKYDMDVTGIVEVSDTYIDIDTTDEPIDDDDVAAALAAGEAEMARMKAAEEQAAAEKKAEEKKAAEKKAEEAKKEQEKQAAEKKAAEEKAAKAKQAQEKAEAEKKAAEEKAAKEKAEKEKKKAEEEAAKAKEAQEKAEKEKKEAEEAAAKAKEAQEKAEAEKKAAEEAAAKAKQEQQEAEEKAKKEQQEADEKTSKAEEDQAAADKTRDEEVDEKSSKAGEATDHEEGENITLNLGKHEIFAEWHKDEKDEKWYACFYTINGTRIYAEYQGKGEADKDGKDWKFYAVEDDNSLTEVEYSEDPSSFTDETGPAEETSYWHGVKEDKWF